MLEEATASPGNPLIYRKYTGISDLNYSDETKNCGTAILVLLKMYIVKVKYAYYINVVSVLLNVKYVKS